nr:zinc finger protein 385A-like [Nerophis lumbriciformis]
MGKKRNLGENHNQERSTTRTVMSSFLCTGGINRAGAAVPAFLRTPTMIQPHLDMKPYLPFPMETPPPPPPPPHSLSLFHNFSTMDPVQKAVINHTFGVPLVKTKRPVISCNVCQIRFNSESQAEAHYKGNRHARRVKGIETSKSRCQDGDKPQTATPTTSPSPPGAPGTPSDNESSKQDETQPVSQLNGPLFASGTLPPLTNPPTPPMDPPSQCALLPTSTHPMSSTSSSSPGGSIPGNSEPSLVSGATGPLTSGGPPGPETEEDKAKKLLYCSLCKVAVNSLSQLEAHNKGTKHKTILEARSGLGPIKAYPRLGPKPSGEQGGGPVDPNTQERTFHCEICNVRVNSELQLKQHISSRRHRDGMAGKPNPLLSRHKKHRGADLTSSLTFSKDLSKALGAGLLPNPLAVAAAMAAAVSTNPLALRAATPSPHPHHHLLQGPPLSHAILRPAPGPIRTAHGPILFSPY